MLIVKIDIIIFVLISSIFALIEISVNILIYKERFESLI